MRITHVSVSLSEKRSANYQGAGVEVGMTASLDADDDPEAVRLGLEAACARAIDDAFARRARAKAEALLAKGDAG